MRFIRLLPLLAAAGVVPSLAASDSNTDSKTTATNTKGILTLDGTITAPISDAATRTGHYLTYTSTRTLHTNHGGMLGSSVTGAETATTSPSRSENGTSTTTLTDHRTVLVGGGGHSSSTILGNGTANATSTGPPASSSSPVVNTRPCNGHPEFCARKYSNITMVAAHNSPFVKLGNIAANQALDVETQLNDGIRMLQFQTHLTNDTVYLCHTSCELLDVGTLEKYLTTVTQWMRLHPYDVVTILIGNYDYVDPGNFTIPIQNSGLMDLVYTPPKVPMGLNDWPNLSDMILSGKRAVMFLDYQANQTAYPWLMDEFSQMWETPFSPTDRDFPCTVQRPPNLAPPDIDNRMYMANHNLNLDINFASLSLLIPNSAQLNQTNAVEGYGSLGWMAGNCSLKWNRPPNFLLVDYYNYGNVNGSVFQVAANMNNVTWDGNCCGQTSAGSSLVSQSTMVSLCLIAGIQYFASIF